MLKIGKPQTFSDDLHSRLDDIDRGLIADAQLLQDALTMRVTSKMNGTDGQATIKRLMTSLEAGVAHRDRLILAHASAQKDAVKMDWPINCPDDADALIEEQETA